MIASTPLGDGDSENSDEGEMEANGGAEPLRKRPQKEHVMTTAAWIKTSASTSVEPWLAPPMKLARTTGECIWSGLKKKK